MSFAPVAALAALVLNEVLYDPPGVDAGREFVEILNVSNADVPLAGLELETGDGAHPGVWRHSWSGTGGVLAPGAFLVVGGDSIHTPEHLAADLQNGPDALRLRQDGEVLDRLGYGALNDAAMFEGRPAQDVANAGLARLPDGRDTGDNLADFSPAPPSPGRRNQLLHNLRVTLVAPDPATAWPGRAQRARVTVRNTGGETVPSWALVAWLERAVGEPVTGEPVLAVAETLATPGPGEAIAAHDSSVVGLEWLGSLGLVRIGAALRTADDDSLDDRASVWVRVGPGDIVINEILYAPQSGAPEWIELWNRGTRPVRLGGFTMADASGRRATLRARVDLAPGAYAIASADSTAVVAGIAFGTPRIEATPWPSLNDSDNDAGYADTVVLRDSLGIVADAIRYAAAGGERGRSIERQSVEPTARGVAWVPSTSQSGTTAGAKNSVNGPPRLDPRLNLAPNPFSPNGDGHDDQLWIRAEVPLGASGFRAEVFDLDGRCRRRLGADELGPGSRELAWDGGADGGASLPTGVYVLRFEWYSKSEGRHQVRRAVGLVRP